MADSKNKIDIFDPVVVLAFVSAFIGDLGAFFILPHYFCGFIVLFAFLPKTRGFIARIVLLLAFLIPGPTLTVGIILGILLSNKFIEQVAIQVAAVLTEGAGEALEGVAAAEEAGAAVAEGAEALEAAGAAAAETTGAAAETAEAGAAAGKKVPLEGLEEGIKEQEEIPEEEAGEKVIPEEALGEELEPMEKLGKELLEETPEEEKEAIHEEEREEPQNEAEISEAKKKTKAQQIKEQLEKLQKIQNISEENEQNKEDEENKESEEE